MKKTKGKKRPEKDLKILLKKEKRKRHNKNFSEQQKQKLVEYRINYYLTHSKQLLRDFLDF